MTEIEKSTRRLLGFSLGVASCGLLMYLAMAAIPAYDLGAVLFSGPYELIRLSEGLSIFAVVLVIIWKVLLIRWLLSLRRERFPEASGWTAWLILIPLAGLIPALWLGLSAARQRSRGVFRLALILTGSVIFSLAACGCFYLTALLRHWEIIGSTPSQLVLWHLFNAGNLAWLAAIVLFFLLVPRLARTGYTPCLRRAAVGVGALAAAVFAVTVLAVIHVDNRIALLQAELRAMGVPIDVTGLAREYYHGLCPDPAWDVLVDDGFGEANDLFEKASSVSAVSPASAEAWEALRQAASRHADLIGRLNILFSSSPVKYSMDFSHDMVFALPMPQLPRLRRTAELYRGLILLAVAGGDRQGAMEYFHYAGNVTRTALDEVTMIGSMVASDVERIRGEALAAMLQSGLLTAADLDAIEADLAEVGILASASLFRTIQTETASSDAFEFIARYGGDSIGSSGKSAPVPLPLYTPAGAPVYCYSLNDYLFLLEFWRRMNLQAAAADLNTASEADLFNWLDTPKFEREISFHVLPSLVLPAQIQALKQAHRFMAYPRLARVACAIERFRSSNGRLPQSLDELQLDWIAADACLADAVYEHGTLEFFNRDSTPGTVTGYRLYCVRDPDMPLRAVHREAFTVVEPGSFQTGTPPASRYPNRELSPWN